MSRQKQNTRHRSRQSKVQSYPIGSIFYDDDSFYFLTEYEKGTAILSSMEDVFLEEDDRLWIPFTFDDFVSENLKLVSREEAEAILSEGANPDNFITPNVMEAILIIARQYLTNPSRSRKARMQGEYELENLPRRYTETLHQLYSLNARYQYRKLYQTPFVTPAFGKETQAEYTQNMEELQKVIKQLEKAKKRMEKRFHHYISDKSFCNMALSFLTEAAIISPNIIEQERDIIAVASSEYEAFEDCMKIMENRRKEHEND